MTSNQGGGVAAARNPAEVAHTRRVAAWCAEVGARLGLPLKEREVLAQAAALHGLSPVVIDPDGWSALRSDLGMAAHPAGAVVPKGGVVEVLQSFQGHPGASPKRKKLALILEQCVDLSAACELDATVSGEDELTGLEGIISEVAAYFAAVPDSDILKASSRLPVFPGVAYRAITLLDNLDANFDDVESLVAMDQTLARHIIGAANCGTVSSSMRVKTISQAITRLGMDAAREIVSAAAMRTLFEAKQSHNLWNHSLDVADRAAHIASQSGLVARGEAFLAGLVHDIGKLVILNLPNPRVLSRDRLTQKGCPGTIVERVILGHSHAAIGARLLRQWRFAESITECVENHHVPERGPSALASVIYMADLQAGDEQELKSEWRRQWALQTLRLTSDPAEAPAQPTLTSLRFAATA